MILVYLLIRATNTSLQRLKTGAQRFGSGDLTYRIDESLDAAVSAAYRRAVELRA